MAKRTKKESDETALRGRKTTMLTAETHARLERYCGDQLKLWAVVEAFMGWGLEQDGLLIDAVVQRHRIGSDRMRAAYCEALKGLTADVCAPQPNHRALLLDESEVKSPSRSR